MPNNGQPSGRIVDAAGNPVVQHRYVELGGTPFVYVATPNCANAVKPTRVVEIQQAHQPLAHLQARGPLDHRPDAWAWTLMAAMCEHVMNMTALLNTLSGRCEALMRELAKDHPTARDLTDQELAGANPRPSNENDEPQPS